MKEYQVSNLLVNNMLVSKQFSRDDFLELLFNLDLNCCNDYRFKVSVIPLFEEVNGYNGKQIVINSIDYSFRESYKDLFDGLFNNVCRGNDYLIDYVDGTVYQDSFLVSTEKPIYLSKKIYY
jgi:hypothetical protein